MRVNGVLTVLMLHFIEELPHLLPVLMEISKETMKGLYEAFTVFKHP